MPNTIEMTREAEDTVMHAGTCAMLRGDTEVATEHLLLSLAGDSLHGTVAQLILRVRGLSYELIEKAVSLRDYEARTLQTSVEMASMLGVKYTDSYLKAVELAEQEAISAPSWRQEGVVGTEHLLIGLALEPNGLAGEILKSNGADYTKLRISVAKLQEEG